MPLLYEPTERTLQYYRYRLQKKLKLSSSPEVATAFLAGVFTGFFVLPIVMTFIGYKIEKMRP